MNKPSHDAVLAATKRTGDAELASFVASPDEYALRRQDLLGVENHVVWRVMLDLDHPMSFWLATDLEGQHATVLSEQLANVHAFLLAEPALYGSSRLPAAFVDLIRNQSQRTRLLEAPAPRADRFASITNLTLGVQVGREQQRWHVVLPQSGTPTFRSEPLNVPSQEVAR